MGQYIINLTEDEEKILNVHIANIQNYIDNIIYSKLNREIDIFFEYFSDKQAKKTTRQNKIDLIKNEDLSIFKPKPGAKK